MDEKKNKPSLSEKIKEGVSVQELETFARKYTVEGFFILAIIVATASSAMGFFVGAGWSLVFGGIGAIISIAIPEAITKMEKLCFSLASKKEKVTQITIGLVQLVLAIFVPFVIFAQIGLLAGITFHHFAHLPKGEEKHTHESKEEPF